MDDRTEGTGEMSDLEEDGAERSLSTSGLVEDADTETGRSGSSTPVNINGKRSH